MLAKTHNTHFYDISVLNDDHIFDHINTSNNRYATNFIEIDKIGEGSFGSVYKAINVIDKNIYAIKKITIDKLKFTDSMLKYLKESIIISKLNHKNIIRYYSSWIEYESDKNYVFYIQMELCDMNLKKFIKLRNKNICGSYDYNVENKILEQIVAGLKYIHANNIIHFDLNPCNIFLAFSEKKKIIVKIADFGLSKLKTNIITNNFAQPSLCIEYISQNDTIVETESSYMYGNPIYMPPNSKSENIKTTKKYDIYSLGVIYVELFNIFKTNMERLDIINKYKKHEIQTNNFLKNTFSENYKNRPSSKQLLSKIKNIKKASNMTWSLDTI